MNSKQRAFLRSLANNIEPIFQIGKAGISSNLIKQLNDALEARELIKISVLNTAPMDIRDIGNAISDKTQSVFVQYVGNKITLYKARKKDSRIKLPTD